VDLLPFLRDSRSVQHPVRIASFALATCAMLGCLPAGQPPLGQHVVQERNLANVHLSPSEQEGVPSYLLAEGPSRVVPLPDGSSFDAVTDLFALPYGPTTTTLTGLGDAQPIVPGFLMSSEIDGQVATDNRGRLIVAQYDEALWREFLTPVQRIDLPTGVSDNLGLASSSSTSPAFLLSQSRARVFVAGGGGTSTGFLVDPAGTQAIGTVMENQAVFIGETLYYVSNSGNGVVRRPEGDPASPEVLLSSTGNLGFVPIVGDRTPQLLLSLRTDGGSSPFAVLDTNTLASSTLPSAKGPSQFLSASSDGHWLLFRATLPSSDPTQPDDHRLFVFDWTTNRSATLDSTRVGQTIGDGAEWRPGTSELWFTLEPVGFAVWRPDADLVKVAAQPYPDYQAPWGQSSMFTSDGKHWFSIVGHGAEFTILVGPADDPNAARFPINPQGTRTNAHWELADGRMLVNAWPIESSRSDIFLIDPDAATARPLATGGHLVAAGQTRALALLDWQSSSSTGSLTLIDFATGAQTALAEDVYMVTVDRGPSASVPPGADALAPGTRVAFLTRNRLDSPYDGLWVAELP
jgi:hypothetical protein